MEEPLLKPRPAVEAFFEQFNEQLIEHFLGVGKDEFHPDLIEILSPYWSKENNEDDLWKSPEFQIANLKFWVEAEKLLHTDLDDREKLVRLDVDLMMSVYMFDVLYCLDNDQKPVMAAYEFVVANSDWFRDNQINLYEKESLFKKVLDTLKGGVFFGEGSMQMDWINRLTDGTTFSDEPKTVTELKKAIRIVTESPDRGGAIVPSGDPPSAIERILDTARPVVEILVLPATAVSAFFGAVIAGSDAAIRGTASVRNFTETEPEYQIFDSGSNEVNLAYHRPNLAYQRERARQRDEKTRRDQFNQRREDARARARQNLEALPYSEADPRCRDAACAFGLDDDRRFVDLRDRVTYRGPPRVSDTEGPYPAEGDFVGPGVPGEEGDGTELDGDENVIELSTDNADGEEYADFSETPNLQNDFSQLGRPGQPQLVDNGTIPRLLNQSGPSGSRIFNWSNSDSDSLVRRLLNRRLGGTAYPITVDSDAINFGIDPEQFRRTIEENQSDAQDDGNGTSTRRIENPSSNGSAFGSLEVGPNGPVPRRTTWAGYNDPAQFDPAYDVIVDGRRIPKYEYEGRTPTPDEALRAQGAVNDAIARYVARGTGNTVFNLAALPYNLILPLLENNGGGGGGLPLNGDLDSAPEGSQSPSMRRKRAFLDHAQTA